MTLRARITAIFMLLIALVALMCSLIMYIGFDAVERYIFRESLETEAEWLSASLASGGHPAVPHGRQFFDAMTVPQTYCNLPLGYHEIEGHGTDEWHLLVFEYNDQRYYLLQDGSDYEKLELYIGLLLLLTLVCGLATAFWAGKRISSRAIAPITQLTSAITRRATPLPYQSAADEIGVLARAFSDRAEELQRYLWREQCFTGDVSHELRTPLAIVLGAAEIIERQASDRPDILASAERIRRTAQKMNAHLTAMLMLSRAPEALHAPQTHMVPIIQTCIERCRPFLTGKPVQIFFQSCDDVSVAGAPELIGSAVHNLLRNACQYTEKGEIRISLTPQSLTIADTGPGLPASIDPASFQRFASGVSNHGEGLGLSIAQRIVNHLSWQMTVDNTPQGCRFHIVFSPSAEAATELPQQPRS